MGATVQRARETDESASDVLVRDMVHGVFLRQGVESNALLFFLVNRW